MKSQFIIQMFAADQPVRWLRLEESLRPLMQSGSLEEAARQAVGARVTVLVPSEDVLLTRVNLPITNRQKILKALPYALEDQVVGDVEDMHFAAGERDAEGLLNVAVCARSCMEKWQERLKDAGLMADVMMPDCLALPLRDQHWSLFADANRFVLRSGSCQGYAFDADSRDFYLGLLAQDAKKAEIETLDFWSEDELELPGLTIERQSLEGGFLQLAKTGVQSAKPVNLLQGDFSRREQLGKMWRPWRFAASVGAIWFVLSLSLAAVENAKLSAENDALKEQAVSIYKGLFPDARKVPNPRQQLEQKLKELQGGSADDKAFMELLATSGPSFTGASGVQLRSLRYKNGIMDVELEAPSLQSLDKLKQTLVETAKMDVEIQSAAAKDNKVQGRLQIKRGAS